MALNPTLEDVARVAGVSRATASRAIRNAGRVSPAAQRQVDAAVRELGYVPNSAARTLVTRETGAIALVAPEPDERVFADPFFGAAIAGVGEALESTDKQLVLAMRSRTSGSGSGSERLERYLSRQQVDGVVVISHHEDDHFLHVLKERNVPTVLMGRPLSSGIDLPYVDLDNRLGGQLAAEHLIAQGARRLATITGPLDMPAAKDRLEGWHEALAQAGLEEVGAAEGKFTPSSGRMGVHRLIESGRHFDGLFAASDMMALTALQELTEHGLRVPEDVKVIGFDDSAVAVEAQPPLSTLTNPARDMAATATRLLLALIAGQEPEFPVINVPQVIARESTSPAE